MLTAVEFFDKAPLDNLTSILTAVPDKLIFIGDNKGMRRFDDTLRAFLARRALTVPAVEYRAVPRNDLSRMVDTLSAIVETEEQCVFDLTGGEDLALVAVGVVYQKYRDSKPIQLQRLNLLNGALNDCDGDGVVLGEDKPSVSVEELVALHGGTIRPEIIGHAGTYGWELTPDFIADAELLWDVCRENPGLWNTQLNVLGVVGEQLLDGDPLSISADWDALQGLLAEREITSVAITDLLTFLNRYGLIEDLEIADGRIVFAYKNAQIKRCLAKAGTLLELKVLLTARRLTEKDGSPFYTDSMSGVFIDWDGSLHGPADTEKDTENEIDVVLMHGLQPVFISCKNGQVGDDELYKLDAVANRFGGRHVKKVLIATYMGRNGRSMPHFRQRAEDMGIYLLDGVHQLTDRELEKQIKHLVNT